jgi:phosphoribosyl 1,2-cyclic phosphodiesterase
MGKILIIDDDQLIRALAEESLAAAGHQILAASDGEAGLRLAQMERPDLVLLDAMAPKLHGYAVLEAIRRDPLLTGMRVIMTSVKKYASDMQLAESGGADRFLPKPFDPQTLSRVVTELLCGPALRVTFWGTRGSIATPGPRTARYGGNTACAEIRYGAHILILDAGTGIRPLGESLMKEFAGQPIRAHIFIGHTHWDHIQGFPFFLPAYVPGNHLHIYSLRGAGKPLEKVFRGQMDADYFPVPLSSMQAHLHFEEMTGPVEIGPLTVRFEYLNHPGLAIGFRVSVQDKVVVYVSDHEPFYRLQPGELGEREERKIIDFSRGADLLIREAQYTEEEYPRKKGWGHSTIDDALRAAAEAQVRRLTIIHHDPAHDDDFLDRMVESSCQAIAARQLSFTCSAAREGEVLEL